MTSGRGRLPHSLELLLRREVEEVIDQANLGTFDSAVAKKYLIERVPQLDIAIELDCERSTISRHLPRILLRIEQTARRLHYI